MKAEQPKPGVPGYRHPYANYEADPLWPLIDKGISDLVTNRDLIEQTDQNHIVGYLCAVILRGHDETRTPGEDQSDVTESAVT